MYVCTVTSDVCIMIIIICSKGCVDSQSFQVGKVLQLIQSQLFKFRRISNLSVTGKCRKRVRERGRGREREKEREREREI